MKLRQYIEELQKIEARVGDVELSIIENDGRSTSAHKEFVPEIAYREIWKGHNETP